MTDTYTLDRRRGFERISEAQWMKDSIPEVHGKIEDIILPLPATMHSAGNDIYSPSDFTLKPNQDITLPLGFRVYMQADECLYIIPRSGLGFKYLRLANNIGLIDSDYYHSSNEGHCKIRLRNEGDTTIEIKKGQAIAQGIFHKYLKADWADSVKNIREGGFGSTG